MWEYSDTLKEHFFNPRNMGTLDEASGVGEVGSISCGDAMKLFLKINDETGVIEDVRFQTFGCGSAIASASALTEMIKGKTVDEAMKITNEDIAETLGGLPPQKMHCSVMGKEALEAAVADYRGEKVESTVDEGGEVVCACFGVTDAKIRRVALENGLTTVEDVTNYTKAGGGCGSCKPVIEDILEDLWKEHGPPEERGKDDREEPVSEFERNINEVLDREVRPGLQSDGGDITVHEIDGKKVVVTLTGHCVGCPMSAMTLKNFVEGKLREFVDPEIEVVQK